MQQIERQDDHERFKELCALAQAGALNMDERADLERHLQICERCRKLCNAYAVIGNEGMALLAGNDELSEEARQWDNRNARQKLFASIERSKRLSKVISFQPSSPSSDKTELPSGAGKNWLSALAAACVLAVVALTAYHAGTRTKITPQPVSSVSSSKQQTPSPAAQLPAAQLESERAQIAVLEEKLSTEQQELTQLRIASKLADAQIATLNTTNSEKDVELQKRIAERDQLANQLSQSEKAYQALQIDLANLRAEHNQTLLHTASLETKVQDMTTLTQEQEHRLKDSEQYLVSDRDIRELMGARKLYIADVFDVDSGSRTRQPFGRVFYTQNKSLVFYAFDLDHQPGVKNASAFQVWGQRDSESNSEAHPMNLGILYMDNEANRRWVLRFDDPKQLAEIDAVFVTVEPHGGSAKPTGKPFLYALLRKEVNHP